MLNIELPYNLAVPLIRILKRTENIHSNKNFIEALFK